MIGEAIQSDTFRVGCPAKSRVSKFATEQLGEFRASSHRRFAISPKRWPTMIQAERICLWTLPGKSSVTLRSSGRPHIAQRARRR